MTGGPAAAFASLAHSYSQLLDCLEQPQEHNVTPNEMGDLLAYLAPRLLRTIGTFEPRNEATTRRVESGEVPSSFPNEQGEFESQVLHDDWRRIVLEFSHAMQLDALQSYHILETYLHLYHYNSSSNLAHFFSASRSASSASSSGSTVSSGDSASSINLTELIHFYYTERCSLLQCIAALFRIFLDDQHPYHAESLALLTQLTRDGLERQLLDRYKSVCEVQMPKVPVAGAMGGGDAKDAPSSLFLDNPQLVSGFADQCIEEQALLLEILFLFYYENDAFTEESATERRSQMEAGGETTLTEAQSRILTVYTLLHTRQFGRVQPLYPFLTARGRATVEWVSYLSVLIGIEVMAFEKLLRVYNHPIQELKERIAASNAGGVDLTSIEQWEENKDAAILILQESETTFLEHPFHDLNFLAKLDHTFFEAHWNPTPHAQSASAMAAIYAPLNLAWSVALSHVYEYLEDVQAIKAEFNLLGEDELGRPITDLTEFHTEKQIILQRLESSITAGSNPFLLLTNILTRVQNIRMRGGASGYAIEHSAHNLPAFKEIVHELLNALFQSTCYSALLSLASPSTLAPIFPLFNRIFHEDSALAFRFWQTDEQHPEDRSPLFDQAIERFPIDIDPFIELLTALAGQTVAPVLRVGSSGETLETSPIDGLADTVVCANRAFEALTNMKSLSSSAVPPAHLLDTLAHQQYQVALNAPWTTPEGVTLPAQTIGRYLDSANTSAAETRTMQWWYNYNAWPLLVARIDSAWRAMRNGGASALTPKEWIAVIHIVSLVAKLVRADANIYAQLTSHLEDARNSNETTMTLYNASNLSFVGETSQRGEMRLLVLLMRVQAFVTLHAGAILTAANSASARADVSMDAAAVDLNATLALLPTSSSTSLAASHLLALLEGTNVILEVASKLDWRTWLRAFTLVMGADLTTANSGIQTNIAAVNLLSSVSLASHNSSFQPTYNYLHLAHRSLLSAQIPLARYATLLTFLDQAATVLLPVHQLATIQHLRIADRASGAAFLPPSNSVQRSATDPRSALPVNATFAAFLTTIDMHHFLKYICESIFIQYDEWTYALRSERWQLGTQIVRFFLLVLSNPAVPPAAGNQSSGAAASPLHEIALQQYLYTLFLTQPSMLLALLRPLLFGLALLDRLNFDRHHDAEVSLLQDLLIHTFLLLKRLMNLESQRATVATGATTGMRGSAVSFHSVLLETVAASNTPSAWTHLNRRRGGRFASTPTSLLQAITEYANYSRSIELQSLAIQTIRLLCLSGAATPPQTSAHSLANYFTPATLQTFRSTCLQLLTGHTTELSVKLNVLQLLATMFERQPTMAQRFAVSSFLQQLQRAEGKEKEPGSEDDNSFDEDDSLFQVLQAYILAAEETFVGDPQALLLIYRILAAIWSSTSSTVTVGHFSALQQRLRNEIPTLWDKLTHCLTADIPGPPMADFDLVDNSAVWESLSSESSSLGYFLSIKLIRNCVWTILNAELFQSLSLGTSSGNSLSMLDPALEAILLSFGSSSSTPHRYIQLLLSYAHTSEQVAVHRQALDQLQQYHLDRAIFTRAPTSEEIDEGLTLTPTYDLDLITKTMQLDLDLAFDRELTGNESLHHSAMQDTSTTSLVLHTGRVDASAHRTRVEELILTLRKVNNSMLLADAELTLLKSWRCFAQICLSKQPNLLGIKPKSTLAYEYVRHLCTVLAGEKRLGEGAILGAHLQQITSLLLSFLSLGLAEDVGSLRSAMLITISRASSHRDTDETASGESVFRLTNDLLAQLATALQASTGACVTSLATIASEPTATAAATTVPVGTLARSAPFEVTARIGTGVLAARVHSTLSSALASHRAPPGVQSAQRAVAMSYMQNLATSTLLLLRWANQLLVQQFAHPKAQTNGSSSPVITRNTSSPVMGRRLDSSFGSPLGRPALAPVLENTQSQMVANKSALINSIGDEYARTCQRLMTSAAACVTEPLLIDIAVTSMPLIIQAIDVIQGAAQRNAENNAADGLPIKQDQEPTVAAIEQLRPMLPLLIHQFVTMPMGQASVALKLMQLFGIMAQYESGAKLLIRHSIVLHICNHRVFTSQMPMAGAPGWSTPYQPSFAAYTPSHTRDPWHQVWTRALHLLSTLLRTMAPQIGGSITLAPDLLRDTITPTHEKLLEEVLGFFNLFSGTRLNKVLHLTHVYQLTIGGLEEIDALAHLIYEFETYGQLWHRVNPALHATQRQQILLLTAYYMRLMNDHRELEQRILVVSPEEKADAKPSEEEAIADTGTAGVKLDFGQSTLVRNVSALPVELERQRSEAGGVATGSTTDKALLDAHKKAIWRPLGASSGYTSGTSTPHRELSTPTTPRSTSTPSSQTPGVERDSSMGVNVMLTPQRDSSSFLLRTPVVGALNLNRVADANGVGFGSMTGVGAADSKHAAAAGAPPQTGFAFFTQRIEYAMCIVLRSCMSYLRIHTKIDMSTVPMHDILFSHRIKIVSIGNTGTVMNPSASMMMLANGFHANTMSDAPRVVGVTSRDKITTIFTGLGLGMEEIPTAADIDFEQDYYENTSSDSNMNQRRGGSDGPYVFRPPLSMLIDFSQYTIRVLTRLFEIQKQGGMLESLVEEKRQPQQRSDGSESDVLSSPSPVLPHSAHLFSGALASSTAPSVPSIPNIHLAMQFLLEVTLYVFTQHAQVHMRRLKQAQMEQLAQMTIPMRPTPSAAYYGQAQAPSPMDLPLPVFPPGALRIGKLLEQYRDRLSGMVDLLARYIQLISTHSAAPPMLPTAHVPLTHLRVSRLVAHLKTILEEMARDLAQHIAHVRQIYRHTQHQLQQQQHQQQQQAVAAGSYGAPTYY